MENSGYTSIIVDGEKIDLRFGIPAVRMYLEKIATDEVSISNESINEIGVATLIHCGYVNNCMVKDIVPEKTFGFFLEFVEQAWIDDEVKKQLEHVSKVYAESKYTKKVIENANKNVEEIKKKNQIKSNGI